MERPDSGEAGAASLSHYKVRAVGKLEGYRNDIQILRALAVLSVVIFHVDPTWLPGGYLGVDIFFVISGYVISSSILEGIDHGSFSFTSFYLKRARRILPALVVTVAFSLAVGALLFTPDDFGALGESAINSVVSVANILFWLQISYFDQDALTKPLLHMWSLSVEEQFYLIWPLLIVLFARLGHAALIGAVGVAGLLSLLGAELMQASDPSASFFLMPFRIFQFAAGCALCFIRPSRGWGGAILLIAGTTAMVASLFTLDESYRMPGLLSLAPTLGAALWINGSMNKFFASMPWKPVEFVGNISYSLYLVHWPLIVFTYYVIEKPTLPLKAFMIFGSLALAVGLFYIVERPLRSARSWCSPVAATPLAATLLTVVTIYCGASAWGTGGWAWRFSDPIQGTIPPADQMNQERRQVAHDANQSEFSSDTSPNVVVIGDSHGTDVLNALFQNGAAHIRKIEVEYKCQLVVGPRPFGMPDDLLKNSAESQECEAKFGAALESEYLTKASVVVLAARWQGYSVERVAATIGAIREKTSAPVVVFGPTVEFRSPVPRIVRSAGDVQASAAFAASYEDRRRREVNDRLRAAAEGAGATYIDKFEVLCASGDCPILLPNRALLAFDYGHWTAGAARYFGAQMRKRYPDVTRLFF